MVLICHYLFWSPLFILTLISLILTLTPRSKVIVIRCSFIKVSISLKPSPTLRWYHPRYASPTSNRIISHWAPLIGHDQCQESQLIMIPTWFLDLKTPVTLQGTVNLTQDLISLKFHFWWRIHQIEIVLISRPVVELTSTINFFCLFTGQLYWEGWHWHWHCHNKCECEGVISLPFIYFNW